VRAPEEPIDSSLQEFYERLRSLLRRDAIRNGRWQLLECSPAWNGNWTWDGFIAFLWENSDERFMVAVNYAPNQAQCYVRLPISDSGENTLQFQDLLSNANYDRPGKDIATTGLYLDLPPWGYHVFEIQAASVATVGAVYDRAPF